MKKFVSKNPGMQQLILNCYKTQKIVKKQLFIILKHKNMFLIVI